MRVYNKDFHYKSCMDFKTPLHILMVSGRKHNKGPIPYITDLLVSGLESLGCKVTLLSCWGLKKENESVWRKVIDRTKDVITITKEAKVQCYDVIYIHSAHSAILRDIVLLIAIRTSTIPTLLLFHGSRPNKLSLRRYPFFTLGTQLALKLVTGFLLLSTEEQHAFRKLCPWVNCGVVPNPVQCPDGDIRNKTVFQKSPKHFTLMFAGRFIPAKGVLEVIEAFPKVLQKIHCQLILAGGGPLLQEVQDRIRQYGIEKHVIVTGYLDRKAMWPLYQQADVLLLPTYKEGFPMVVLEAMANGVGIICTQVNGLKDYLQEGVNALFVPFGDPERLAERIIELLSDHQLLSKMHKANLELSKEFEPVKVARRHLEVMARLIPELKEKIEALPGWKDTK